MHSPIQMMWPSSEVVNYTFETVADGIPIPWEWLGCRTAPCWLLRKWNFIPPKNGSKPKWKCSRSLYSWSGGLLDIVLHPDYAKNGWIYITYASTEGGGEGGNTHKSQTRKRKSRPNRITIQMRGNTTKGQHFGSQLYLTMKVICTSQQENVAQSCQSTRHHSWQRKIPLHADGRIPADNFVKPKKAAILRKRRTKTHRHPDNFFVTVGDDP
jgi:glucose/arabinose dehydrogenase